MGWKLTNAFLCWIFHVPIQMQTCLVAIWLWHSRDSKQSKLLRLDMLQKLIKSSCNGTDSTLALRPTTHALEINAVILADTWYPFPSFHPLSPFGVHELSINAAAVAVAKTAPPFRCGRSLCLQRRRRNLESIPRCSTSNPRLADWLGRSTRWHVQL